MNKKSIAVCGKGAEMPENIKKIIEGSKFDDILNDCGAKGVASQSVSKQTDSGNDNVNKPKHYTQGKIDCIDAMIEAFGVEAVKTFCKLNAFKYLWRSEHKNGVEDIDKARWYTAKYVELSKKETK